MRRLSGKQARFVAVYDLSGRGTSVLGVEEGKERESLAIRLSSKKVWNLTFSPKECAAKESP